MESKPPARSRTLGGPARWLMLALAGLCVLLGVIGLFLPVMPTVPFLIVAAWAASRSSPRLHDWLHHHPRFGRQLRDWNEAGVVPRRAKWITAVMMSTSAVSMLVLVPQRWWWAVLLVIACMATVLAWLWRRPEQRPDSAGPG